MGVFRMFSSSSADKNKDDGPLFGPKDARNIQIIEVNSNPNPKNYKIIKHEYIYGRLILKINYPDSTNYEGNKILVYNTGVTISQLKAQGSIDPHFSETKNYISPIARFEPTFYGWTCARRFAFAMKFKK